MHYFFHSKRRNRRGYLIIHEQTCPNLPSPKCREKIGRYRNKKSALKVVNSLHKGKGLKFKYCQKCLKVSSLKVTE